MSGYILLVEDNPDDELLALRAFKKAGLGTEVKVARDGAEALAFLHGPDENRLPGLVLLDLKLPKIDGLEVLKRIRAEPRTKLIPVVILTTSREEQDVVEGYSRGANSYIRKPVSFPEFVEAAGRIGVYWLELNEQIRR